MPSKYEKLIQVATVLVRLDIQVGHLRWKVTDLARASRTPRSRIYELLGSSKSEILFNALTFLIDELYGISAERVEYERRHGRPAGLKRSRQLVTESPELLAFYFRHRLRGDAIGTLIRKKESEFLEHVRVETGLDDPIDVLFARTFIHGVSLAPFLSESEAGLLMRRCAELIQARKLQKL